MDRRAALSTIGTTLACLAGCTTNPGDTPGSSPSPTPDDEPEPTAQFSVHERGCGSDHETADVTSQGAEIVIDGIIGGSDTCDTATLSQVQVIEDVLTIGVETIRESTDDQACAQCLTDIEYTATITLNDGPPDQVVVLHDGETVTTKTIS